MTRTTTYQFETIQVPPEFESNPSKWLGTIAKEYQLWCLLAFAYDGVIWGIIEGDQIQFAQDLPTPALHGITLQEARIFSHAGELLIWKTNPAQWQARILRDNLNIGETKEYFDQKYLLWGKEIKRSGKFVLLQEGSRGILHTPPIPPESPPEDLQLSLTYRHYLEYDPDGQAYIALSRLVSLNPKTKEEER